MTDTTAGEGVSALLDHMKLMQRTATAYLVPEDYRDRNGRIIHHGDHNNTEQWKQGQRGFRAEAFANDILYLLDGPEQREAEAKALAAQPSAGAQREAVAVPRQWLRDLVRLADDFHPGDSDGNVIDLIMDGYGYSRDGEEKDGPTPYDRSGDKALWDHRVDDGPNPYRATPAQPGTGDAWNVEHKLDEAEGFGASYIREEGRWTLYTMPGAKPFGSVDGYDKASVDFVMDALRATRTKPDTGDVAALRSVTNMDRVREFHETFGVPVLPIPCIPAGRVKMRLEILDEERRELDEALESEDLIEVADALTDMAYLIYGTALEFGIDLNACFAEVHRSNMSKLGADGKPIYREDGKVLKGPSYSPPDLRAALSKPNAPGREG